MKRVTLIALLAFTVAAGVLWPLHKSRTFQFFGRIVNRVETQEKVLALTFDDGPTAETDNVLAVLRELQVPATFFLIGTDVKNRPEDTRKITMAGHEIGNHSLSHTRMVLKSTSFYRHELEQTDSAIRAAGYTGEIHFRPPNGKKLFGLPYVLWKQGRTTVMWDLETDSAGSPTKERIVRDTLAQARPGSIILLHVMAPSRVESRAALPEIIQGLKSQGYRFVTVQELLKMGTTASPAR